MKKNQKFLVAGIIIVAAIIYLVFMGVKESSVYFMTVAELKADHSRLAGEGVRISGTVIDGSIEDDVRNLTLNFNAKDEDGPDSSFVRVTYKGVKPDSFKPDVQVILEGKYDAENNLFKATTLLVKCPSRYEGEVPPPDYKPGSKVDAVEGIKNAD